MTLCPVIVLMAVTSNGGHKKQPQVSFAQMNISEKRDVRRSIGNCDEETRSMDEKSRDGGAIFV